MLLCTSHERTSFLFMRTVCIVFVILIYTMPVRCALGCERRGVHRFPNHEKFPNRFKVWVHLIGGKLEGPEGHLAYQYKRICDIHFTEKDYNRNNRLNATAVPSQHLPAWCSLPRPIDSESASTACSKEISMDSGELPQAIDQPAPKLLEPVTPPCSTELNVDKGELPQASDQPAPEQLKPVTPSCPTNVNVDTDPQTSSAVKEKTVLCDGSISNINNQVTLLSASNGIRTPRLLPGPSYIALEHNYCLKPKASKKCSKIGMPSLEIFKMKALKRQVTHLKNEVLRLRKRGLSYKARLANAIKMSDNVAFKQVTRNMTDPAKLFTYMNFREASKRPKGRRFTIDEKVLSLSIFKRSPKCYTLLSKYFTLPSKKSLKSLLASVYLKPGINDIIFEKLKNTVKSMNIEDTLCTLIFDEMSITPQIQYNTAKDELKGFTSSSTKNEICDHVLVFMVKGIKTSFKQPVAYYFTNSLNKEELKSIITEVIKNVHLTGLKILCTVCDQSTVNVSAINILIADTKANMLRKGMEWREEHFRVNQKKIIPIYDCPHLLKGLRNNLLTKDLIYEDNSNKKIIKWSYFEMLYAADKAYGELRCVQKLTEEHINRDKIKKMKVKSAAQIFSRSVAVATEHLCARGDLPQECRDLIPFVIMIDNLFDSLNSSTFHIPNGKIYKAGLKKNSPHHELWQKVIRVLKSAKFIKKKFTDEKIRFIETTVPSLTNFVKTVEAVQYIWKILHRKYSFDCLLTRNLNQDPLENFFGNIRSYGYRNVAPNCTNFEGAFKALLLNNFSSPHSIQANCEEDNNSSLQDLKFFLTEKAIPKEIQEPEIIELNEYIFNSFNEEAGENDEDKGQRSYVCGWVVTKCLKMTKSCIKCKKDLLDMNGDNSAAHSFTKAKEYNSKKKWLCYPSKEILSTFQDIQRATCAFLKRDVPKYQLKAKIKIICDTLINYKFTCRRHNLKDYFVDVSINLLICSWCRAINRILSGKISFNGEDELKLAAQAYYNKHIKRSKNISK